MSFFESPSGGTTGDVIEGRLVPSHPNNHGPVDGGVGLSVTASVEAVAVCHTRRCRDWADTDELRERGFGGDAVGVVTGHDHHLRGTVRSDPVRVSQGRNCGSRDLVEESFVFLDFGFELVVSAGQGASRVSRRGSRVDHRAWCHGCAGLEEVTIAENRELFAQRRWSVHDDGLQGDDRRRAGFTAVSLAILID